MADQREVIVTIGTKAGPQARAGFKQLEQHAKTAADATAKVMDAAAKQSQRSLESIGQGLDRGMRTAQRELRRRVQEIREELRSITTQRGRMPFGRVAWCMLRNDKVC